MPYLRALPCHSFQQHRGMLRQRHNLINVAPSAGSAAFAEPPLGFRVKKAKVSAPIDTAVSPIAAKPFDDER